MEHMIYETPNNAVILLLFYFLCVS